MIQFSGLISGNSLSPPVLEHSYLNPLSRIARQPCFKLTEKINIFIDIQAHKMVQISDATASLNTTRCCNCGTNNYWRRDLALIVDKVGFKKNLHFNKLLLVKYEHKPICFSYSEVLVTLFSDTNKPSVPLLMYVILCLDILLWNKIS